MDWVDRVDGVDGVDRVDGRPWWMSEVLDNDRVATRRDIIVSIRGNDAREERREERREKREERRVNSTFRMCALTNPPTHQLSDIHLMIVRVLTPIQFILFKHIYTARIEWVSSGPS